MVVIVFVRKQWLSRHPPGGVVHSFRPEVVHFQVTADIEWLECHKHEQIKELISNNVFLTEEVQRLLQGNQSVMLARFDELNDKIARILGNMDLFTGMVKELAPDYIISENALEILRILFDGSVPELMWTGGDTLQLWPKKESIRFNNPRFLDDDINVLVRLEFLTVQPLHKTFRSLKITRKGVEFFQKHNTTQIA